MERKTKVHAEDGNQEILITREFDLPLPLLFKAYTGPGLVEQWMGTWAYAGFFYVRCNLFTYSRWR